jgi:hypothetical protein
VKENPGLHGPTDPLTDAQAIRLFTAIAELKAMRAALDAGMSVAELESLEWLVHVKLLDGKVG